MNFDLKEIPERTVTPRETGLTMVMDKGMSLRETEDFISISGSYVDVVKIGFGTSFVTPNLKEKLAIYKKANVPFYFGGTLFEAFVIRDQFDDYLNVIEEFELEYVEVSDGAVDMPHEKKCEYITQLSEIATVFSEVGSKDDQVIIPPYKWIELMESELKAGAWKVIAEARESGTVGIFRGTGEVRSGLVDEILTKIPSEKVLWEAPKKPQQVWFIELIGCNVNLGNISPSEVIGLETMRIGLRADTLKLFLNGSGKNFD
ncbi:MAG: phosphosulfolactate synthase [Bacteroidetes bacterium]|nr:phosphosulfolactate synthase [Bacteroidota bacterium]